MTSALSHVLGGEQGADAWTPKRRARAAAIILGPLRNYPDQMELGRALVARSGNLAAFGTRRSGKTEGIARVILALLLQRDRFVVRMLTTVLAAPTINVLERLSDGGAVQWLRDAGVPGNVCRIDRITSARTVVAITFAWGSALLVHDIGSLRAVDNKHGLTADVYWIDEATKTPLLEFALRNLINPTLADHGGIKLLSYTPDDELDGLPAQLAKEPHEHWGRHHLRQWRNPHFGASFGKRWARISKYVAEHSHLEYGLSDEDISRLQALTELECDAISTSTDTGALAKWVETLDPELLRNLFGRWVRFGARYVYPWHKIPPSELYYCATGPLAARRTGRPGTKAMADRVALLPQHPPEARRVRAWEVSLAFDLGTVDAWAGVALAWSRTCSQVYELDTRKAVGLGDDEMFDAMADMIADVDRLAGVRITSIVGDLAGMRKGTQISWDRRLRRRFPRLADIGIRSAPKRAKAPRIRQHWLDMMQRRLMIVAGGELDKEGRHLQYKADKPAEVNKQREVRGASGESIVYGDHALDAMLYGFDPIPILDCIEPNWAAEAVPHYFRQDMY